MAGGQTDVNLNFCSKNYIGKQTLFVSKLVAWPGLFFFTTFTFSVKQIKLPVNSRPKIGRGVSGCQNSKCLTRKVSKASTSYKKPQTTLQSVLRFH